MSTREDLKQIGMLPVPGCTKCLEAENHAREHEESHPLLPMAVAVDTALMKLSDAKPGDVLVITVFDGDMHDGYWLSEQVCRAGLRLPAGALPKGGIPVVVTRAGVKWSLERPQVTP